MGNLSSLIANDDATESVIIVWLDNNANKTVEGQQTKRQLQNIVDQVKVFEDAHECEKYIRSRSTKKRFLLIVNDRQATDIIAHVNSLKQVVAIYIHGKERWALQFSKVKATFEQFDELMDQIRKDQKRSLNVEPVHSLPPNIKINPSRNYSHNQFAYSQLLSNVLLRSKPLKEDQNDLITLCENSESDLKMIHQFAQTYTNHKALWWYTRLTCFNRMLNQALRTQDISTIFLFQFFIHDLHQQLVDYQCQYPIRTYRSQLMIDEEINHLRESVGSFISIHTFFSTIVDRNRALFYLDTSEVSNEFHRVLFDIDADPVVVTSKPFADITRHSEFPQEREVLFSIGSLFRIDHIEQNRDGIWIIKMTLSGENHPDLKILFDETEKNYGSSNGDAAFVAFSRVLREMKKIDEAEKYCFRLLQTSSIDAFTLNNLYNELMDIALTKENSQSTLEWIEKSIQNNDHQLMAHPNNHLRFSDIAGEEHEILLPIQGFQTMPLVSLEEAIEPLVSILPDIRLKARIAKQKCRHPADGLTSDQSAAIMLYTIEWEVQNRSLYFVLNMHLRTPDRTMLKPWFLYLKLIFSALSHLPSIQRTVYRGVKLDLSDKHPEKKEFFWWGFSSCTTTINVLKSDQFLGKTGPRTFFHIECLTGKDIRHHSYYGQEEEILLLPATYFQVTSLFEIATDLHVIQLKEIPSDFALFESNNVEEEK